MPQRIVALQVIFHVPAFEYKQFLIAMEHIEENLSTHAGSFMLILVRVVVKLFADSLFCRYSWQHCNFLITVWSYR